MRYAVGIRAGAAAVGDGGRINSWAARLFVVVIGGVDRCAANFQEKFRSKPENAAEGCGQDNRRADEIAGQSIGIAITFKLHIVTARPIERDERPGCLHAVRSAVGGKLCQPRQAVRASRALLEADFRIGERDPPTVKTWQTGTRGLGISHPEGKPAYADQGPAGPLVCPICTKQFVQSVQSKTPYFFQRNRCGDRLNFWNFRGMTTFSLLFSSCDYMIQWS